MAIGHLVRRALEERNLVPQNFEAFLRKQRARIDSFAEEVQRRRLSHERAMELFNRRYQWGDVRSNATTSLVCPGCGRSCVGGFTSTTGRICSGASATRQSR